jgi:AraC-like DNA-binding protein
MTFETVIEKNIPYIKPLFYGHQDCESSHSYGPAVRTHWLIHYVTSGKGIFRINGKAHNVKSGEMFVIPPYIETYYEADSKDPWEYIWLAFECEELPCKLSEVIKSSSARQIFEDIRALKNKRNSYPEYLSAKIWELFSVIKGKTETEADYVETALGYMHTEYINGITVQEIAEKLNLNRTYFSVIFKQKLGVSPSEYLLNFRMKQAMDLLTDRSKSISITALSVGYPDIYTFSKAFKRYYGASPRKYAKKS